MADHLHPGRARRRGYFYLFTDKHHGGDASAARWSPDVSEDEEFSVFDDADQHELSDERQWLYGVLRWGDRLRKLGTYEEQVAAFPRADDRQPWHGYPLYPLKDVGQPNRRGDKCKPDKIVFEKMHRAGLLTKRERRRLSKGDHA